MLNQNETKPEKLIRNHRLKTNLREIFIYVITIAVSAFILFAFLSSINPGGGQ